MTDKSFDERCVSIQGSPTDEDRVSTLLLEPSGQWFSVMGNLPHGYRFRPTTDRDRDRLVRFLQEMEIPEKPPQWRCSNCKGTSVQVKHGAWFDPNDALAFIDGDWESELESFCEDCGECHPLEEIEGGAA